MRSRLLRVALALTATAICAASAHAYVIAGTRWPGGYVPYHVDAPALRSAVDAAAARWNRSGADVRLVDVPAAKAQIRVRALTPGRCLGVVGRAPIGYSAGQIGVVYLQPRCGSLQLIPIAAHELGHVLGFAHDTVHCSVMTPVEGTRPTACGGVAGCRGSTTARCSSRRTSRAPSSATAGRRDRSRTPSPGAPTCRPRPRPRTRLRRRSPPRRSRPPASAGSTPHRRR